MNVDAAGDMRPNSDGKGRHHTHLDICHRCVSGQTPHVEGTLITLAESRPRRAANKLASRYAIAQVQRLKDDLATIPVFSEQYLP